MLVIFKNTLIRFKQSNIIHTELKIRIKLNIYMSRECISILIFPKNNSFFIDNNFFSSFKISRHVEYMIDREYFRHIIIYISSLICKVINIVKIFKILVKHKDLLKGFLNKIKNTFSPLILTHIVSLLKRVKLLISSSLFSLSIKC